MFTLSLIVPFTLQPACQRRAPAAGPVPRGQSPRFSDTDPRHLYGAWCVRLTLCCLLATRCLAASPAPLEPPSPPPPQADADALDPPAPDTAVHCFQQLEEWVRKAAAPPTPIRSDALVKGACVVLRRDGVIMGRGTQIADDGTALWQAATAAIEEARRRMNLPNDAVAEKAARAEAAGYCISLELAGSLIPIHPATFTDCDLELQAGLDGVAARIGATTRAIFPGWMLASGSAPSDALASVISAVGNDPTLAIKVDPRSQPPQIAADRSATFYRFRTTHLAQVSSGASPTFLFRGGQVVEQRSITKASLESFAARMFQRLDGRPTQSQALRDPYFSFRGTTVASADPITDNAVRCLAMVTYASLPSASHDARAHALAAVGDLRKQVSLPQQDLSLVHVAALAAVADAAERIDPPTAAQIWQLLSDTKGALSTLDSSYEPDNGWAAKVTEPQRAFVAYALVCRARQPGIEDAPSRLETARTAVRTVYKDTRPSFLVGQMPWLGWAERSLARGEPRVPAAAALRDMRDMIWKHQLSPDDAGADSPDLAGGIIFTASKQLLPTWHSARPLAFVASMLADPRLTDEADRMKELSRLLASLRFLRQLAVDDTACFACAAPETALWGIRASLWDQRQAPEATAMTLICVCETLTAIESLRPQSR